MWNFLPGPAPLLQPPRPAAHSASGRSRCGRTRALPAPAPRRMEGAGPRGAGPARRRVAGEPPLPPLPSLPPPLLLLLLLWLLPGPAAPQELNPRGRNVCRAPG